MRRGGGDLEPVDCVVEMKYFNGTPDYSSFMQNYLPGWFGSYEMWGVGGVFHPDNMIDGLWTPVRDPDFKSGFRVWSRTRNPEPDSNSHPSKQ